MKPAVTDIDAIMFPGESRRLLDAQIAYVHRMLDVIDSSSRHTGLKSALEARPAHCESVGRDVTEGANSLAPSLSMTLSNGETIKYQLAEIYPGLWNAYDDNDTSGSGGWGPTKLEAIRDLRERSERESCSDGRARVMTEPQRRDREWQQKLANTQI